MASLPVESFALPITTYLRSHFLTARAAARRMIEKRSGAILMHTPEPARLGAPLVGGMGPAWAALEALTRSLSAALAAHGERAACLRSTGLPETGTIDVVFGLHSKALGIDRKQFLAMIESRTHRRRSTSLAELADVAVFLASDRASGLGSPCSGEATSTACGTPSLRCGWLNVAAANVRLTRSRLASLASPRARTYARPVLQ